MIHASEMAMDVLRGLNPEDGPSRSGHLACTGKPATSGKFIPAAGARRATGEIEGTAQLPTCPLCIVLWDAAASGTPPALPPRHDPTTGG